MLLQAQVEEREKARQAAKATRAAEGQAIKQHLELERSLIEASPIQGGYPLSVGSRLSSHILIATMQTGLTFMLVAGHPAEEASRAGPVWCANQIPGSADKRKFHQGEAGALRLFWQRFMSYLP